VRIVAEGYGIARRWNDITPDAPRTILSPEAIEWFRDLAAGDDISVVARRAGYSEREMYRRLRRAYVQLGVTSRTSALIALARMGYL